MEQDQELKKCNHQQQTLAGDTKKCSPNDWRPRSEGDNTPT